MRQPLPTIDLHSIRTADPERKRELLVDLRTVCHEIGFFYVKHHGIDPCLLDEVLNCTKAFFDLPLSDKDACSISLSPHFRGYGRFREELTEGVPDRKETFDLGLESAMRTEAEISRNPFLKLIGPKQWPNPVLLPSFQRTILAFIDACRALGLELVSLMSQSLGLSDCHMTQSFQGQYRYAMLRLIRYPPACPGVLKEGSQEQEHSREQEFGVGPHVDAGCLALLHQDAVGGLQVQTRGGEWMDAPPIGGTLLVNLGRMLQVWTDGFFLATPHRVLSHPDKVRVSAPFFLEPDLLAVLHPLPLPLELREQRHAALDKEAPASVYGEHMLRVFERSFQSKPSTG